MKKFKEEFLKDVLDFDEEKINLVLKCQKIFPELLGNEATKINSAKKLYDKLELKQSNWARWYATNIVKNEFFKENKDWWVLFAKKTTEKGGQVGKDFSITTEFAKHLVMQSKAKKSHEFRNYFIYIEKAIRGLQDHINIREPERKNYNIMVDELIKLYSQTHSNITEFDKKYLRIRESNMINKNLLGLSASEVKDKLGYLDSQTREHLKVKHNSIINDIEFTVTQLIVAGISFDERSKIIENICKNKYPELKMDKNN